MFDGVIDEIDHRIEQEVSVARDKYSLMPGDFEMATLVFGRCIT